MAALKCKDCDQTFGKKSDLEEHQTMKEHSCDVCGKEFFLKWRLKSHI